ncbi:AbrB/MazE/SpoVT family DNA-binding domain-containing protein [Oceanobacillus sojae]|uniref:AbrB/MazE/SpoVT family DNA-binding domain-containing protein n=1 Tax=Oceanobacillus sojae TaxID=582851 RepID=UPI0009884122|nr:AbrB/MazE/SpoVT family DNA-binding domain-containing protein [Oceanobacillus sojae]MCT1903308.1 AbrB/MazE/SpoVT family DNA-binding domain-containing protein [Oceanobacillus sojae]
MAVKHVERKITKIGNSLGITLPPEVLKHLKAQQGDDIRFELKEDGSVSVKRYKELNLDVLNDIDQDFLDGLQDLFENYDDTLRNLADR